MDNPRSDGWPTGLRMRRTLATLIAALMLAVCVVPLMDGGESSGYAGDEYRVTYNLGTLPDGFTVDGTYNTDQKTDSVTVTYQGVPTAEYNPQFWSGSFTGTPDSDPGNWYPVIIYRAEHTLVFNGWALGADGATRYDDDGNSMPSDIYPGDDLSGYVSADGTLTLTATWAVLEEYQRIANVQGGSYIRDNLYTHVLGYLSENGDDYNTELGGITLMGVTAVDEGSKDDQGKVRPAGDTTPWNYCSVSNGAVDYTTRIVGDVTIDKLDIRGCGPADSSTHGNQFALYLNGYRGVFGPDVESSNSNGLQVYGGSQTGNLSNDTRMAFFGGTYSVLAGGCFNADLYGSTHLNIVGKGVRVTDTVYGGSITGTISGSTNVLVAAGKVWDGKTTGISGSYQTIVGGCRYSTSSVQGGSNITVTGSDTTVFAVQGGGRAATTSVSKANVTVSGSANVLYMVNGSVTDGNQNSDHIPVGEAYVAIRDSAVIGRSDIAGSVYGGGWDTWTPSIYSSTGSTHVSVEGDCTIYGSVYGGGFRGSVGADGSTGDTVSISISGGVIKGSVYGGGQGGPDPLVSNNDSTGRAYVNGNVVIGITGGDIGGSVYGGGQGAAMKDTGVGDAAKVTGDVRMTISGGAVIGGSVYGGGFGVDGSGQHSVASILGSTSVTISLKEGSIGKSVYGGGSYGAVAGSTTVSITGTHIGGSVYGGGMGSTRDAGLGSVGGDVTLTITGSEIGTIATGTVYGGGMFGSVVGSVDVSLTKSNADAVYGGGMGVSDSDGFGSVGGDVTLTISDSDIGTSSVQATGIPGALYGGGSYGSVKGATSVTVASSTVMGSVFGGGQGTKLDSSASNESVAAVLGGASVSITGSTVYGDVYGGGEYGRVGPASGSSAGVSVSVAIRGTSTVIGGSVYLGGLGESGRLAVNAGNGTLTINGPTVNGSVFGGSRFGNDNCETSGTSMVTTGFTQRSTSIYIISGNIRAGSSGNVYGGGYRGFSNMDSDVYVGTSASTASRESPQSRQLLIHSVYGGSSVGTPEAGVHNTALLRGDTSVSIGGRSGSDYDTIRITGDVFGAGDYCDITGSSSVTFNGFRQSGPMLSVQKVDDLLILGSELTLSGNVDGNTTTGSAKLSLNDIGVMTLRSTGTYRSGVTLESQASSISGYRSEYPGSVPTYGDGYDGEKLNYIIMEGGKMFSVLGGGNDGDLSGVSGSGTYGVTLFSSSSNTYYGAFVVSGEPVDGEAEFIVRDEGALRSADTASYASGGNQLTVWYIAGAYTVDETVILDDTSGTGTVSASESFTVPKMASGSTIQYLGHYLDLDSVTEEGGVHSGSLNLVDSLSGSVAGQDFMVVLGAGSSGLTLNDGKGINLAQTPADSTSGGTSGAMLNLQVSTLAGYRDTGYVGSVHIHMIETLGTSGIPLGVFDITVSIYLRIHQQGNENVEIEKVLLVSDGGTTHTGSTDIYLPTLDGNRYADYRLTGVSGLDTGATMTMTLAPTNLGKSGWVMNEGASFELKNGSFNIEMGRGGVYDPVLVFGFECNGYTDCHENVTVTISVTPEDGSAGYTVKVKIFTQDAPDRTVDFYDKWLSGVSGGHLSWSHEGASGWVPTFSLGIEFGSSLTGHYVALDKSFYDKKWGSAEEYVKGFSEYLLTIGGVVLTGTLSAMESTLTHASGQDWTYGDDDRKYSIIPIYSEGTGSSLLDIYVGNKPYSQYTIDGTEHTLVYSHSIRWFDSEDGYTQFNFHSSITDSPMSIYAGYGFIVEFDVYYEGDSIANHPATITPGEVFYADITTIFKTDLLGPDGANGALIVPQGYVIQDWGYLSDETFYPYGESVRILEDTTIQIKLTTGKYDVTISFEDVSGNLLNGIEYKVSPPISGDGLTCYENVTITVTQSGYAISSVTAEAGALTVSGTFTARTYTFTMPAHDVEVTIVLKESLTVTVQLTEYGDSGRFQLSGTGSVTVSEGSGSKTAYLSFDKGDRASFTLKAPNTSSGNNVSLDVKGASCTVSGNSYTIDLGAISKDATVEVTVWVEWRLTLGTGYTATVDGDKAGSTVRTGQTVVLTATGNNEFPANFTATNVDVNWGATQVTLEVLGTGDVTAGSITVAQYGLTVNVVFLTAAPSSGTMTVSISGDAEASVDVSLTGLPTVSVSFSVAKGSTLDATASLAGYVFSEVLEHRITENREAVTVYGAVETTGSGSQAALPELTVHVTAGRICSEVWSYDGPAVTGSVTLGGLTVTVDGQGVGFSGLEDFTGIRVLRVPGLCVMTIISHAETVGDAQWPVLTSSGTEGATG